MPMLALWQLLDLTACLLPCSGASVDAVTQITVVCLARNRFVELLGPLEQIMQREKSDQVRDNALT